MTCTRLLTLRSESWEQQMGKETASLRLLSLSALLCINMFVCQSRQETLARRYELKGTVVSVDPPQQVVIISHDEIVGDMGAMTIPFTLKQKRFYNWTPADILWDIEQVLERHQ